MSMFQVDEVSSEETIARLLNKVWFVEGVLQQSAFQLRNGESYLSVNRTAIDSYKDDVAKFVSQHPDYKTSPNSNTYSRALMNVGEVRGIDFVFNGKSLNVSVEVEPRTSHIKSHAGIFARYDDKNIKGGQVFVISNKDSEPVSTPDILQKLRWKLLQLSTVEVCRIN